MSSAGSGTTCPFGAPRELVVANNEGMDALAERAGNRVRTVGATGTTDLVRRTIRDELHELLTMSIPGLFRPRRLSGELQRLRRRWFVLASGCRRTLGPTRLVRASLVVGLTMLLVLGWCPIPVSVRQGWTQQAPAPEQARSEPAVIPTRNLFAVFRDGGILMIPIAACSCGLGVFLLERFFTLRRSRVIPGPFVKRFIEQLRDGQLDRPSALALCEENRSAVAQVFAAAIKKWGRPTVEVEQAIIDEGERVVTRLRRYLRVFHFISTVTPLLGLLGTVLGMIEAFNVIAASDAMGRAELLAGGIGQALITTAAGLTVAIPALTAYSWFAARVDRLVVEIDSLAQQVVECVAGDVGTGANRVTKPNRQAA